MRAAVEDVHHRHGQQIDRFTTQVTIKGELILGGCRAGHCHRNSEDRVCAEAGFIFRAVQFDELLINGTLLRGVHVGESIGNLAVHVFYRLQHALAEIAPVVAIAEFDRFMFTRRSAAGHNGASNRTVRKLYFSFDRRIAARVEHFAGANIADISH